MLMGSLVEAREGDLARPLHPVEVVPNPADLLRFLVELFNCHRNEGCRLIALALNGFGSELPEDDDEGDLTDEASDQPDVPTHEVDRVEVV